MSHRIVWRARALLQLTLAAGIAISAASAGSAASPTGYLPDASLQADLGISLPPAPDNRSEIGRLDLAMVVMAQTRDPATYQEAYEDASAYDFDKLMTRFSAAAGTELAPRTRPILAHILSLVIADTKAYASFAKAQGNRDRPYLEDPRIVPCETDYLRPTDHQSYPSGHATNGYAAALVMADIMPERTQPLLERGIRYGSNRVVCGVHHPIDVEQGRLLAIAYFAKMRSTAAYLKDRDCAIEEHGHSLYGAKSPLSAACAALDVRYRAELKV